MFPYECNIYMGCICIFVRSKILCSESKPHLGRGVSFERVRRSVSDEKRRRMKRKVREGRDERIYCETYAVVLSNNLEAVGG